MPSAWATRGRPTAQNAGTFTEANVRRKLELLQPHTEWIRIFSCSDGNDMIPLTIRDPESWYKTLVGAWLGEEKDKNEWIYGAAHRVGPEGVVDALAAVGEVLYNAHNEGVLGVLQSRPDDLLVLDIAKGEGWEPLCKFLECPVPAALHEADVPETRNRTRSSTETGWPSEGPPSWRRLFKVRKKRVKFAVQIAFGRAMGWL